MGSTKRRLQMALTAAGIPVDTVTITGADSAALTYMEGATEEKRNQGAELLAAFDWSAEADAAWQTEQKRAEAKRVLGAAEAMPIATRAACLALMASLQEARGKINEIITTVNAATGSTIGTLATGDSFADALETVAAIIDSGAA